MNQEKRRARKLTHSQANVYKMIVRLTLKYLRVPSSHEVAEALGVSRAAVHETAAILRFKGFIAAGMCLNKRWLYRKVGKRMRLVMFRPLEDDDVLDLINELEGG